MKIKNISIRLNNDNKLIIYTNVPDFISEDNSLYIFKQLRNNRKYIKRVTAYSKKVIRKVSRFENWDKRLLSNCYDINNNLSITLIKNTEIILLATLNHSHDTYKEINVDLEFYNHYKISLMDIINVIKMGGTKEEIIEFKEKAPYPIVDIKLNNTGNTVIMYIKQQGDS